MSTDDETEAGLFDDVVTGSPSAVDDAGGVLSDAFDSLVGTADQAYDAAGDYVADHATGIQDTVNSVSSTTGVSVDLDGSDGAIGVKVDTSVLKADVVDDATKGFTGSGEVKIDAGEAGKYGAKGNIGLDAGGDLTALGGGATVYVPVDGVLVGGDAEAGWSTSGGTDTYTAGVMVGAEKDGLVMKQGLHARYDDSDNGDYNVTVGRDMVVGFEDSGSKTGIEEKLSADLSYGEKGGDEVYGAKVGSETKLSVNGIDVAKGSVDGGVNYTTGESGDVTTYQANAQGQIGNSVYTPTAQGSGNVTYVTGTDADGNPIDQTSYGLSGKADSPGLGVHLAGDTGGTFADVAAAPSPAPLVGADDLELSMPNGGWSADASPGGPPAGVPAGGDPGFPALGDVGGTSMGGVGSDGPSVIEFPDEPAFGGDADPSMPSMSSATAFPAAAQGTAQGPTGFGDDLGLPGDGGDLGVDGPTAEMPEVSMPDFANAVGGSIGDVSGAAGVALDDGALQFADSVQSADQVEDDLDGMFDDLGG